MTPLGEILLMLHGTAAAWWTRCSDPTGIWQHPHPRGSEWWGVNVYEWGEECTSRWTGLEAFIIDLWIFGGPTLHNVYWLVDPHLFSKKMPNIPVNTLPFQLSKTSAGSFPAGWHSAMCTPPKHPLPPHMHSWAADCFDVWQVSVETEFGFVWVSGPLLRLWHHLLDILTRVSSKEAATGEDLTSQDSCVPHRHSHTLSHTHSIALASTRHMHRR